MKTIEKAIIAVAFTALVSAAMFAIKTTEQTDVAQECATIASNNAIERELPVTVKSVHMGANGIAIITYKHKTSNKKFTTYCGVSGDTVIMEPKLPVLMTLLGK